MIWKAYLLRTMTGQVGRRIKIFNEGSWDILLNDIEETEVHVDKKELRTVDESWWSPWHGGILITAESAFYDETPIIAGPIVDDPEETFDTAKFKVAGIRAVLTKRVVTDRNYRTGEEHLLVKSVVSLKDRSLGTIAWNIVQLSLQKTGGYLPIVHGSPNEYGSHLNERTYEGFNLANNMVDKRLTELSDVINGPDIMFRPRWTDKSMSHVEWVMVHGTAAQPEIYQKWTMSLDATSYGGPVQSITKKSSAEHMGNRVYWTGAGEGAGTAVAMEENIYAAPDQTPLLELVGSDNDAESAALLREKARAGVAVGEVTFVQFTVVIDGDNESSPLGRWHVGDAAYVKIENMLKIPDGTYKMRIISAKGRIGSQFVTLEFQEDVL